MHDKLRCMLIVGNYHILQLYTSIARLTTLSRVQTPVCLQVHLRGHSKVCEPSLNGWDHPGIDPWRPVSRVRLILSRKGEN